MQDLLWVNSAADGALRAQLCRSRSGAVLWSWICGSGAELVRCAAMAFWACKVGAASTQRAALAAELEANWAQWSFRAALAVWIFWVRSMLACWCMQKVLRWRFEARGAPVSSQLAGSGAQRWMLRGVDYWAVRRIQLLAKLKFRWDGPYTVVKACENGVVTILNPQNGQSFTINGQRWSSACATVQMWKRCGAVELDVQLWCRAREMCGYGILGMQGWGGQRPESCAGSGAGGQLGIMELACDAGDVDLLGMKHAGALVHVEGAEVAV
ncbi:hypothetical protein Taro_001850 [Colocasia esculenta]|uniref:Uncharacterized protein n=1 Tax=Colocasia esculenta TaxID=4460 RepID=A0A843TH31_COLES|nr:hypothetical protein [Colocasia esculenta]